MDILGKKNNTGVRLPPPYLYPAWNKRGVEGAAPCDAIPLHAQLLSAPHVRQNVKLSPCGFGCFAQESICPRGVLHNFAF